MSGSARLRGILEKQSLEMTRTVEGKRFREGENSKKTVSRVRSGKINARPMPRTSVDVRCMHVSQSLAISCKALHVCRTPS